MAVRRVLVVGAGIAGSTLAYWLGRNGVETTVVERSASQRSSGSPVDVRGAALAVVEQMNVLPSLHRAATRTTVLAVVDARGRRIGWIPIQAGDDALEIPRTDLVSILAAAAQGLAEFRFDDSVAALQDDGDGVDVTFERTPPGRFDLVVGADGLHSRVRRLAFGPESQFVTHLGMYLATTGTGHETADRHTVLLHGTPGRAVAVHPVTGVEGAGFFFRDHRPGLAGRDPQQQKRLVAALYAGMGWRVPELLERLRDSQDVYFDAVSRVRTSTWSRGRTTLVGDAASCVSLFGEGSSMAVAGAANLARALAHAADDPSEALQRYEHEHRKRLARAQRGASVASHLLVPGTRTGLTVRDTAFRVWSGLDAVAGRARRARSRPPPHGG